MLHNLNNIFPSDYPNPPSERDLKIEVQDMLRYCERPYDALVEIAQTDCPYYREALLVVYEKIWLELLHTRQDFAGYPAGNAWFCYWPDYEADFCTAYNLCENQQKEIRLLQPQPAPTISLPAEHNTPQQTVSTKAIVQQITTATKQAISTISSTLQNTYLIPPQITLIQHIHLHVSGDMVDVKGDFNKQY